LASALLESTAANKLDRAISQAHKAG